MADARLSGDVRAALALAAVLTVGATLAGSGSLAWIVVPVVFGLIVYAMCRVPVRQSMLALMFFAFTLPNPAEGHPWGDWDPPFSTAGALLLIHLNNITPLSFASFSGMDLFFAVLGVLIYVRKASHSKLDSVGRLPTPRPLLQLAWVSLAATAYVMLSGLLRGGDFRMSLWQLNAVMYVPLVFLLFQYGLRGASDIRAVGRVVLAAAVYKGLLATWIIYSVHIPPDPDTGSTSPIFATTHADSMLFADACVVIASLFIERVKPKAKWLLGLIVVILVSGMIANNRRLVWVHITIALLTVYLVTADGAFKRKLRRALLLPSPAVAIYIMAGWESAGGSLFKPVRMLRSVVDPETDTSTFWRELENLNLITTIRNHPVLGVGYGHGYEELVALPAISYDLERYLPHNSILGLWCYCGYFGYAFLTLLWVVGIYFAMRAYRSASEPLQKAGSLCCISGILIYLMHCWGDLGLSTWTGVFSTAVSIALAGKLAVASGGWQSKKKPASTPPGAEQLRRDSVT